MKKVGTVTHYYGKIKVAIVDLVGTLKVGDQVKFENGTEFEQPVESMQIEHQQVEEAKKGDMIGLGVKQKVHEGATVYLVEEE
jgi:putative protease